MDFIKRKDTFIQLGRHLAALSGQEREDIISRVAITNQWFVPRYIHLAINGIIQLLNETDLEKWLDNYPQLGNGPAATKKIGVIMAGNIPGVGFHDALCVLLSGHKLCAKLSTDDPLFPRIILEYLTDIEPAFSDFIVYTDQMKDIDALIATGSDNSARYFEYYFSKIPHIIRRNRTSMAILDGDESGDDIKNLGEDIFNYFGRGCRNVSKIFIPEDYKIDRIFEGLLDYSFLLDSKKYTNNYQYNRAIYLLNLESFFDNNFLIIKESDALVSPVSVLFYQRYNHIDQVLDYINQHADKLQCIVSKNPVNKEVKFGQTQAPAVWEYADNIDTMQFILSVDKKV